MKKILMILALVVNVMTLMAQEAMTTNTVEESILVERFGNTYYANDLVMNQRECAKFLKQNNIPIYKEFQRGLKQQRQGWVLLGVGLGLDCAGVLLTAFSPLAQTDEGFITMVGLGVTTLTAGVCCNAASVCLLAIGYSRMHDSVDMYNINQKYNKKISLNLAASQNGVGLALNF